MNVVAVGQHEPVRGWFKSSFSQGATGCVEVNLDRRATGEVFVRDTKDGGAGPVLAIGRTYWSAFVDDLCAGRETTSAGAVALERADRAVSYPQRGTITTTWHLREDHRGTLHFDDTEWDAFRRGIQAGEFDLTA